MNIILFCLFFCWCLNEIKPGLYLQHWLLLLVWKSLSDQCRLWWGCFSTESLIGVCPVNLSICTFYILFWIKKQVCRKLRTTAVSRDILFTEDNNEDINQTVFNKVNVTQLVLHCSLIPLIYLYYIKLWRNFGHLCSYVCKYMYVLSFCMDIYFCLWFLFTVHVL